MQIDEYQPVQSFMTYGVPSAFYQFSLAEAYDFSQYPLCFAVNQMGDRLGNHQAKNNKFVPSYMKFDLINLDT